MKNIYLLLFLLIALKVPAQVCGKLRNTDGSTSKVARVQIGKDTVQMGVPFKVIDKLGMGINFHFVDIGGYSIGLDLRTDNKILLADVTEITQNNLYLITANSDTVKLSLRKKKTFFDDKLPLLAWQFFYTSEYITVNQLSLLTKEAVTDIRFYIGNSTYIDQPVSVNQQAQLKRAVKYMLGM